MADGWSTSCSRTTRIPRTTSNPADPLDLSNNDSPAAFRNAVNSLAFTMALTWPPCSSITIVLAGSPLALTSSGAPAVGTDTTFIVVPEDAMRDGMKSAVWFSVDMAVRCGWTIPGSDDESCAKTLAMRPTSSSGLNRVVASKVSCAERTRRDMLGDEDDSGGQEQESAGQGRAPRVQVQCSIVDNVQYSVLSTYVQLPMYSPRQPEWIQSNPMSLILTGMISYLYEAVVHGIGGRLSVCVCVA